MIVVKAIKKLIAAGKRKRKSGFNVVEFLEKVGDLLRDACSKGCEYDSASESARLQGQRAYLLAADFLAECGFPGAAEQLLIRWWNELGARQLSERKHIYRAMTAFRLCQSYLAQGDSGAALRWALLCHADDRLHEHSAGGGAGMQYLRTILGATQADLDAINGIADENLKAMRTGNRSQSRAAWFAEDVLVRLAQKGLSVAHLFSRPSLKPEFPISKPYLTTLLRLVDADDTGSALEKLASYLFLLVPGWFPTRNARDVDQVSETDIYVSNLNPVGNLAAELMGRHFLVECKDWKVTKVPVLHVGYFLHRMQLTHCGFGVILATKDITGETKKDNAATGLIRRTFHEDRNLCIVLDKKDLEELKKGGTTFWTMLMNEIERLRFGKAPPELNTEERIRRRKRKQTKLARLAPPRRG